jgi:hypothetical protein
VIPKRGEVVTFTYDSFKSGLPVNPVIYRSRSDVSWEDVVREYSESKPSEVHSMSHFLFHFNFILFILTGLEGKAWSVKKMRMFFENFAQSKNKDPTHPSTWQSLANELMQLQVR